MDEDGDQEMEDKSKRYGNVTCSDISAEHTAITIEKIQLTTNEEVNDNDDFNE